MERILIVLWLATGEINFVPGFQDLEACRSAIRHLTIAYNEAMRTDGAVVDDDGDLFSVEGLMVGVCAPIRSGVDYDG